MKNITINTKNERIRLMDDGIVDCQVVIGLLDLEGAKDYVEAIRALGGGKKMKVFLDLRKGKKASQSGRNYVAKQGAEVIKAMAILIDSPFSKMISSFFIGFSKPLYPTEIFTEKEKAIQWLKCLGEIK